MLFFNMEAFLTALDLATLAFVTFLAVKSDLAELTYLVTQLNLPHYL